MLVVRAAQPLVVQAGGRGKPRCTIMPFPVPARSWQGAQKTSILLAAAREQFGRHGGFCVVSCARARSPRATVPGTGACNTLPSAEQTRRLVLVILRLRIHVGTRAAGERTDQQQRAARLMASPFRPRRHRELARKSRGLRGLELLVVGKHAEEEAILRGAVKAARRTPDDAGAAGR